MALNYLNACYGSQSSDEDEEENNVDNSAFSSWETRHNEMIIRDIINQMLVKVERICRHHNHNHHHRKKRFFDLIDSDSDSDLSPWSLPESDNDYDSKIDDEDDLECDNANRSCRTKGELTFDDLPQISRLNICSPVDQLTQLGIVTQIVNQLVIIKSFTNIPALDLDSTVFWKDGTELGQVFDVIGSVRQPNYVIRFNSQQEIKDLNIQVNMPVYFNAYFPQPYTKYVFVNELRKERGSDASWKDNNEPPPEAMDYSDDEQERKARWKHEAKTRRSNY